MNDDDIIFGYQQESKLLQVDGKLVLYKGPGFYSLETGLLVPDPKRYEIYDLVFLQDDRDRDAQPLFYKNEPGDIGFMSGLAFGVPFGFLVMYMFVAMAL